MGELQIQELQTQKVMISDLIFYNEIDNFLKEKNGTIVSNKRILGHIGTKEGYDENKGKWIFFNLEGKKLRLTKYMTINDNNELVSMEWEKWEALCKKRPEKAVYSTDNGIEQATEGRPLVFGVWSGGLGLYKVYTPGIAGRVAYDKLVQADPPNLANVIRLR